MNTARRISILFLVVASLLSSGAPPAAAPNIDPFAEKVPINPYLPLFMQYPISPTIEDVLFGVTVQTPPFMATEDEANRACGVPAPVCVRDPAGAAAPTLAPLPIHVSLAGPRTTRSALPSLPLPITKPPDPSAGYAPSPVGLPPAGLALPSAAPVGLDAPRVPPTDADLAVLPASPALPASAALRTPPALAVPSASPFPDTPKLDQRTGLLSAHFEARRSSAELRREIGRLSTESLADAIHRTPLDRPHLPLLGMLAESLLDRDKDALDPSGPLSSAVRYRIARALAERGDPRCVPVLQAQFARNKAPGRTWAPELFALGIYYRRTGAFHKAAETYLRAAAASTSPEAALDARLEAARAFAIAGDEEKAAELYSQVVAARCDNGWIKGMALYDCADRLREKKRYEQALAVLNRPITGKRADQVAVAIAFVRGRILLEKGDRKSAAAAFRKAVALYDGLPDPLDAAGLGDVRAQALRFAKQLELGPDRPPFQVSCRIVTIEGPDEDGRWIGRFDVIAPRPFDLEVRPGNPVLKCRLGGAWVCDALEARRRVTIVTMDAPPAGRADILVFDAGKPDNKAKVSVRAAAMPSEARRPGG